MCYPCYVQAGVVCFLLEKDEMRVAWRTREGNILTDKTQSGSKCGCLCHWFPKSTFLAIHTNTFCELKQEQEHFQNAPSKQRENSEIEWTQHECYVLKPKHIHMDRASVFITLTVLRTGDRCYCTALKLVCHRSTDAWRIDSFLKKKKSKKQKTTENKA